LVSKMANISTNPIIENWLSTVAYSHSNSENTRIGYIYHIQRFLNHVGKMPEQILEDYEKMDDKQFKRYYSPQIMSLIVKLQKEGYAPSSQSFAINAVKSFFKYNDLPLNYIPTGHKFVVFHNRDITKVEIEEIIKIAEPREKAFYVLMVQSGLRPNEICNLRIENLEELLTENTQIPCLIRIPQEQTKGKYSEYFTFAGKESIYYIKEYLKRRTQPLNPGDYLFTKEDNKTSVDTDLISHMFRRTVNKLKSQKLLDFKNRKGEKTNRNEIRLYNLRKYFRNKAGAGQDYVNFWMGHTLGVDDHYFSKTDIEQHRRIYKETAMYNLRISEKSPSQTEQTIIELQNKLFVQEKELKELKSSTNQIQELKEELAKQQAYINKLTSLVRSTIDKNNKEPELEAQEEHEEHERKLKMTEEARKVEEIDFEEAMKSYEEYRQNSGTGTKIQHLDWESAFKLLSNRLKQLEELNTKEKKQGKVE
jgi:integrase